MRLAAAALLLALSPASVRASDLKIERLTAGQLGLGSTAGAAGPIEVAAEQVLVQFSSATTQADKDSALLALGGVAQQDTSVSGWVLVTLSSGASVVPYLSRLNGFHGVVQVVPNRVLHFNAYPSDPGVPQQYALTNTDAFAGWDFDTGGTNLTTVAMIDSGVDFVNQPDLIPKYINDPTVNVFCNPSGAACAADNGGTGGTPVPACGHGTETASVSAAATNNGVGIAGVSWGAQIASIRVFNPGCAGTTDAALANAIHYVYATLKGKPALGNIVVNMSIGGNSDCSGLPLTQAQLGTLTANLIPIAISAGNFNGSSEFCNGSGTNGVDAPANCAGTGPGAAGIIPVGATDSSNNVASFSCQGAELAAHGVSAPGNNVLVDALGGGTTSDSGTSFSSPFVAGLMALMRSAKPALTPAQIETALRGGANSIGGQSVHTAGSGSGAGQVNVFRSMKLAVNGTLANFDGDQKAIAFPNPFRVAQATVVSFSVPTSLQSSNTEIKIYTVSGRLVRDLKTLVWDGKNDAGQLVASGTYLFEVKTDAGQTTGRMAVIR